jgi:hypothetical protein
MATEDPALPPNPELLNRQPKWFKPVLKGAIVASVLFVIALLLFARIVMRPHHHHSDQTEAISNARQIGLALFEFETDYGAFPDATTIAPVEKANGTAISLTGTSSNALFRQIFAANITQSEQMFYAKTKDSKKPDGDIRPGNILEPRSCGFSYITGLSTKDDPNTPIALTPLIPGTTRFDPKPLVGKAVVLFIDNSVRSYNIAEDGHIYDKGINLLSPKHPIWKGKAPDIRYPE